MEKSLDKFKLTEDIRKLQGQVVNILKHHPDTRNSDSALLIKIIQTFYPTRIVRSSNGVELIRLSDFYDLPNRDSVKRVRAHIQNDYKMYPPTDWKIAKARKWNETEWKVALNKYTMATANPDQGKMFDLPETKTKRNAYDL